jgi:hypothetical protein
LHQLTGERFTAQASDQRDDVKLVHAISRLKKLHSSNQAASLDRHSYLIIGRRSGSSDSMPERLLE